MKPVSSKYQPLLDRLGVSASTLCAIHCAAMPFLLSILPAIGLGFLANTGFEIAMIAISITIGVTSLGSSFRIHRKLNALMMMASGAMLLIFNFFGHESHSAMTETLHPYIAAIAGLMIASAHWVNIRLCDSCDQCAHDHDHAHDHGDDHAHSLTGGAGASCHIAAEEEMPLENVAS